MIGILATFCCFGNFLIVLSQSNDAYDYLFNVGLNNDYSNTQSFGCASAACNVTKTWFINGTCNNPTLSVSIIETDYSFPSYEYASIYINDNFISKCNDLNDHETFVLVDCTDVTYYNITQYIY